MNISKITKTTYISIILLNLALATLNASNGVAAANTTASKVVEKLCGLKVETPHISRSLLKSTGKPYIKANVISKCQYPQTQTQITIALYKMGLVDHVVAQKVFQMKRSQRPSNEVASQDTIALCVTKEPTRYYTIAYAKSFIQGKWMYAGKTRSPTSEKILCGSKSLNPFS